MSPQNYLALDLVAKSGRAIFPADTGRIELAIIIFFCNRNH